jgi:undecaprenyl-diphosphatase
LDFIEAIILGVIQGLTEFLPVSSSGHLEISKYMFGIDADASFSFSVAVHGATVLSTIVVFWHEIVKLIRGSLEFRYNEETAYVLKILISLLPVMLVGLFLKDYVESYFDGNIAFVGAMLIITAVLLISSGMARDSNRKINYLDAFIIGIAQAFAVLPGISRSGATISAGLLLGNKRNELAKFSFLMVLIPVLGANFIELTGGDYSDENSVGAGALIAGFIAAFVTGYIACRWMINIVRKGKLFWFGLYCLIIGIISILVF